MFFSHFLYEPARAVKKSLLHLLLRNTMNFQLFQYPVGNKQIVTINIHQSPHRISSVYTLAKSHQGVFGGKYAISKFISKSDIQNSIYVLQVLALLGTRLCHAWSDYEGDTVSQSLFIKERRSPDS